MAAYSVVKHFEIFKDPSASFFSCLKAFREHMPFLERRKERFGHRIVVTVTRTAHALDDAVLRQESSDTGIGVLLPAGPNGRSAPVSTDVVPEPSAALPEHT